MKNLGKKKIQLLKRKGVFPYEFMTGFDKLQYGKLPVKKVFYRKLNNNTHQRRRLCTRPKRLKTFRCKTMRDYHDLYLKTDVLLLTDIMENFRKLHELAWEAALKITNVNLELLTDLIMYLMVENGIRGGISTITKRYAKVNNKYMKNYDVYNLYGWILNRMKGWYNWLRNLLFDDAEEESVYIPE